MYIIVYVNIMHSCTYLDVYAVENACKQKLIGEVRVDCVWRTRREYYYNVSWSIWSVYSIVVYYLFCHALVAAVAAAATGGRGRRSRRCLALDDRRTYTERRRRRRVHYTSDVVRVYNIIYIYTGLQGAAAVAALAGSILI